MLQVVVTSDDDNLERFSADIRVNGRVVVARSCVNTGERTDDGEVVYEVDDGSEVCHFPSDGAVVLAKKLLDTVENPVIRLDVIEDGEKVE